MVNEQNSFFDINSLVKQAQSGDKVAENALLKHLRESFRLVVQHRIWNNADTEDIVQDTLLTVCSKYKDLKIEVSFAAWAYKILNHKIMDYVKRKKIRSRLDRDRFEASPPLLSATSKPDLKKRLLDCFKKVNDSNIRQARILNLYYQGYSTEEICKKLKISKNNAYVLLNRARTALEKCLEIKEHK
ncbi:MAG: sigma-70 family RNA polymerase sigma factor [candidate division Zixibacteria bacterium]|nr:sigma-70 family RNA polymerase sigma factor [candidate division Zixibacteria bacterium]